MSVLCSKSFVPFGAEFSLISLSFIYLRLIRLNRKLMCASCSVRAKQQAKMAEYCRTIFGDALLIDPLEKYPVRLT